MVLELDLIAASAERAHPGKWDTSEIYSLGDVVRGADENWYRSLDSDNQGNDPLFDDGSFWHAIMIFSSLTLKCGTSGSDNRFVDAGPGLAKGFSFIRDAVIAGSALVTLQIADNVEGDVPIPYNVGSTFILSHAFGSQILIVGNSSQPERCVLNQTAAIPLFVFATGSGVKLLDGLTLTGPFQTARSVAISAERNYGVVELGPNIRILDFDIGIQVYKGHVICSSLHIEDCGKGVSCVQDASAIAYGGRIARCGVGVEAVGARAVADITGVEITWSRMAVQAGGMGQVRANGLRLSGNENDYYPQPGVLSASGSGIFSD